MANQKWVNLVMEEKAQDRTIGVITKSDTLDEEDYEPVRIIHAILTSLILIW